MKNYLIFIFIFILIFNSCKKNNNDYNKNCFNIIIDNSSIQLVSSQDFDTIKYLFQKNNLSYKNLQFYHYVKDDVTKIKTRQASCYQYVNNLKVFLYGLMFEFTDNDSLRLLSGHKIANINLRSTPIMYRNQVRDTYIKAVNSDSLLTGFLSIKDTVAKECLKVEFGYYDLNAGSGDTTKNFTTAWKINPDNNDFPYAYINDLNGKLIYYFDGIIINKK